MAGHGPADGTGKVVARVDQTCLLWAVKKHFWDTSKGDRLTHGCALDSSELNAPQMRRRPSLLFIGLFLTEINHCRIL